MESSLTQLLRDGPLLGECPRTPETRGTTFAYLWRSRDAAIMRRIEAAQKRRPAGSAPIAVFIYGHTHLPDLSTGFTERNPPGTFPPFGFSPVRNATTPVVLNGGAWQRTVTPNQLEAVRQDRHMSDADLLKSIQLEQLPPCYSFVQIAAYDTNPAPRPEYWYQPEKELGKHASGNCNRQPVFGVSPVLTVGSRNPVERDATRSAGRGLR